MLHSYEGLDRPGGVSRRGLMAPLRHRDFRLLWLGMCVSLLGVIKRELLVLLQQVHADLVGRTLSLGQFAQARGE